MNKEEKRIYINSTIAYCPLCQATEQARIIATAAGVFMERICPVNGTKSTKIAANYQWYMERMSVPRDIVQHKNPKKLEKGCPFDCGICQCHVGGIRLPIFSITNDCNLNCPICFTYNRPDKKYYKSIEDTQKIINTILEQSGGVQILNLTGGEPTLHPQLFDILETCKNEKIGRVTMNTNGLRIAEDMDFAKKIKASGVQPVLSLDTFDPQKSIKIHGKDISKEKRRVLEIFEELDIPVTILAVCIKGVNEEDVQDIVREFIKKPFVRSITIQNMTFTGLYGSEFEPRDHITIDEVEALVAGVDGFSQDDFFSLGSYHPLCYSAAYYIVTNDRILSLSKLLPKALLSEFTKNSYIINPSKDFSKYFLDGISELWAHGEEDEFIKILRNFITELYPKGKAITENERLQRAEKMLKMVYIHPHMDEDNFDIGRVSCCGDLVPHEAGQMIPACSYNLLYRQKDPRFWVKE